jgi:CRISPR-associated protein Csx14
MTTIALELELLNPGQFFACCGLLELADRLWPGTEGCFNDATLALRLPYQASTGQPLVEILEALLHADLQVPPVEDGSKEDPVAPLQLGAPFFLHLDHWRAADTFSKTWAGNQKSASIAEDMRTALRSFGANTITARLLGEARPMTGRFGYDARSGWNALDVGYSPNAQDEAVRTYPAVELLAAIGLQGFRPRATDGTLKYHAWPRPLPVPVARAACPGALPIHGSRSFRFRISARGN